MKWKLRQLLDENGDTLEGLAEYLGIAYQTLSKKLNEHTEFTRSELKKIKQRYNLTAERFDDIFFS